MSVIAFASQSWRRIAEVIGCSWPAGLFACSEQAQSLAPLVELVIVPISGQP
jgi:hypothetical protein